MTAKRNSKWLEPTPHITQPGLFKQFEGDRKGHSPQDFRNEPSAQQYSLLVAITALCPIIWHLNVMHVTRSTQF